MRRTLHKDVTFTGVGLHSGAPAAITIARSDTASGINFLRVDVPLEHQLIPARYDLVTDTQLCTRLTNEHGVSIGTVEHVMAAIAGCGITDAFIAVDGPEVPIMDGSSAAFVQGLLDAGFDVLTSPARAIRIINTVTVEDKGRVASLAPSDVFEMDYRIAFDDPVIGEQNKSLTLVNGAFVAELSDSRTFGHLSEVEHLRNLGLAQGGSMQNAIVVDQGRVLNPDGLRHADEFVRHKMLDAVGDLALAGAPIIGRYQGVKAGHEMTNLLLRELFKRPDCWVWDIVSERNCLGGEITAMTPPMTAEAAFDTLAV
ncbi:MAG: UDP-3-O-acyl-N-acetylglucosamine deacetylase [Pseudomonadota bacterium]